MPLQVKCGKCKEYKDEVLFSKCARNKNGLHIYCKKCKAGYQRKYQADPEKVHEMAIKSRYGIAVEFYNKLLSIQDNSCAICKIHISKLPRRLDVDHEHARGFVRGLLCKSCNLLVGKYEHGNFVSRSHPLFLEVEWYIINEGVEY